MSKRLKQDQQRLARSRKKGITGEYKQFDQAAFTKHNGPAIASVVEHLDSQGIWAKPNDDGYGPDLVVWTGFRPTKYIEVEQRAGWDGRPFPWEDIHIPERKGKLMRLGLPCDIWVLDASLKFCVILPYGVIKEHGTLKEFRNSRIANGELFFHVPIGECLQEELG